MMAGVKGMRGQGRTSALAVQIKAAALGFVLLMPGIAIAAAQGPRLTAPGRIQNPAGIMAIGTAASGVVKEILVHEGSRVHAGDVLAALSCAPLEAEKQLRTAELQAAQAVLDRVRHGPRREEIAVAEAVVGYSNARAEEAGKTYERTQALREGVSVTTARILETLRDARVSAAQLGEAKAKLALLRAGSREEDIREAESRRNMAAAQLERAGAELERCAVRAPVDGVVVDVLTNAGEFISLAVPAALLRLLPDAPLQVRAEIDARDLPRVCVAQPATFTADAFASTPMRGQVESISPVISARTLFTASNEARAPDVGRVILRLESGGANLPSGLPVTVVFGPCPSN
jgi:multidrug resistance efflux pump